MSGSLNKVSLIGRLGADPEVRSFQNGGRVTSFSLATSESWKDSNTGERKERTEWHRVAIFNEALGAIAEKYLAKGSLIYLEGKLETRQWERNGETHYSTEVVLRPFVGTLQMLGDPGRSDSREPRDERPARTPTAAKAGTGQPDQDDDIPF